MNECFLFYRSFYDALQYLEADVRAAACDAVMGYAFDGIVPQLDGTAAAVFTLMRPVIDAQRERQARYKKAGEYGHLGAKYGKLGGRPKKQAGIATESCAGSVGNHCTDVPMQLSVDTHVPKEGVIAETYIVKDKVQAVDNNDLFVAEEPCEEHKVAVSTKSCAGSGEKSLHAESDDFETIWQLYGRKGNKKTCMHKWKKLKTDDRRAVFEHVPKYVDSTPEIQFRKNFDTYINKEAWKDEIIKQSQKPLKTGYDEYLQRITVDKTFEPSTI